MIFKVLLIGFGKIANAYKYDVAMSKYYEYSTHLKVLQDNPKLSLVGVVDKNPSVQIEVAKIDDNIQFFQSIDEEQINKLNIDIVVVCSDHHNRIEILKKFPNVAGILIEKPLASSNQELSLLDSYLSGNNIPIQVNLWRRSDIFFRSLIDKGILNELVGEILHVNVVYGNGVLNNGIHMLDFVLMLLDDPKNFNLIGKTRAYQSFQKVIGNDENISFHIEIENKVIANFNAINFLCFRENAIELWGTKGNLRIFNEGLTIQHSNLEINRAMQGEKEIAFDCPKRVKSTVGSALYNVYENLISVIEGSSQQKGLNSGYELALISERFIHNLLEDF